MDVTGGIAAGLLALLLLLHLGTALATLRRVRSAPAFPADAPAEPVTLVIPVVGLTPFETRSALSALDLTGTNAEILYCAFAPEDPAAAQIRAALAARPDCTARLLTGRTRVSDNPKMDAVEQGLAAATADLVVMIDGNVEVPPDLIARLLAVWDGRTGLVSSPPLGTRPAGFWAEVECALLNSCFARWQLAGDELGGGFAHGKLLAFRRSFLDAHGGIEGFYRETAEDAAITKLVRSAGLGVRLCRRPIAQPLGPRGAIEVWNRTLRWALVRRRTYPLVFAAEVFLPVFAALAAALVAAESLSWPLLPAGLGLLALWYGTETALAAAAGWPAGWRYPFACAVRDVMMAAIWILAWFRRRYVWRGQAVEVRSDRDNSGSA
ncbi:glycosyltransferase family 21 protein [Aquabacter spiritensis]|uniref:Ceramide glucosyltransferase n=1 Tax=Aquabacter spiritensis TaxID=933073 RepID=A0A4R3LZ84_9HYPH|nr:glycosyltransferase [Aquabacter spiritensis]TCT05596.1 ceramide glucosyltransferase [Aquabacter spiritensis]